MAGRLAEAARHAVVMRGRQTVSATAEFAPGADVDQLGEHAVEFGEHSPEIAERDWWRHALVRLTRDVTTGSPYTEPIHHRAAACWSCGRPAARTGRSTQPSGPPAWTST